MSDGEKPLRLRAPHPAVLIVAYLLIALVPLGIAYTQGVPARPVLDEVSSALAIVAYAILLVEFVLSGRFRMISGRMGIDVTMRFHQLMARPILLFLLIHPFIYSIPYGHSLPWDETGQLTLGLGPASLATGLIAWILLVALIVTGIARDKLPYRYETWRILHGAGAAIIAIAGAHHAIAAGRYSGQAALELFWLVLVGIALSTLVFVYVVRPLLQLRRPYRVVSVEKSATKTWTVQIEPRRANAIEFEAGQFVWLKLGRSPFAITEHPFSISSCPAARPRLSFDIKEAGDFTNTIGSLQPGTVAYVDGPHGNLTLSGRNADGLTLIAGGVGMAPIMSILRQLRADGDTRPIRLVYGNRIAEQILYRSELEEMKQDLKLEVHLVLSEPSPSWEGLTGVLDNEVLAALLGDKAGAGELYVVCGPTPMIESIEETLRGRGVRMHQIISEKFSYD